MPVRFPLAQHQPITVSRQSILVVAPTLLLIHSACGHAQEALLPRPDSVTPAARIADLRTIPVPHDRHMLKLQMVNASLPSNDNDGTWVLDFAFKPLRIKTVDIPGKGRCQIHYLYYKVVNRTGKARLFAPRFTMVNEVGQNFEANPVPESIKLIQLREDATIPLLGADRVTGLIPPSAKPDADDAVFGAATWETWDPKDDRFSIYVRGLSDGLKELPNPVGGKPIVKEKALRVDFTHRGDIRFAEPSHEWVYW